jgi:hypothetical protein
MFDVCAAYGGALSVYFGLSAGVQLLDLHTFNLELYRNVFTRCAVLVFGDNTQFLNYAGNAYGGAVSVYIGAYSSSKISDAVVGDTVVRNANLSVETVTFSSCRAIVNQAGSAYGGSFSFYVGAFAWSYTGSKSGSTTSSGVSVFVKNITSSNCVATGSFNAYGGSMSIYVGAFALGIKQLTGLLIPLPDISVACGTTNVTNLVVSFTSSFFNDSLVSSDRATNVSFLP